MSRKPRVQTVTEMQEPTMFTSGFAQAAEPALHLPCTLQTFVPIPVRVLCGGLTGISSFPLTDAMNVVETPRGLAFDFEGARIQVGWANVAALSYLL